MDTCESEVIQIRVFSLLSAGFLHIAGLSHPESDRHAMPKQQLC